MIKPQGPRSVGEGFRELDPRIDYFIKFDTVQNFGDYLPEIICKTFFTYPRLDADVFRLVGSVIDDRWARQDLRRATGQLSGLIAYWCCGARGPERLSDEVRRHCRFFGVRGQLTRDVLGLPTDTVLGDPGLLAPLFHSPRPGGRTAGRTICIPHIHDLRPHEELLALSGCDVLVHPRIDSGEAPLRTILDEIAAADFVLTASLHGAIIACAYGRPFAFWGNGHLDVPFKWQDFARSVNIAPEFVGSLAEGREHYAREIAPIMALPPLAPILDVAPFVVRPAAMLRALAHDGAGDRGALTAAADALDGLAASTSDEVHLRQGESAANRAERMRLEIQLRKWTWRALQGGKRAVRSVLG